MLKRLAAALGVPGLARSVASQAEEVAALGRRLEALQPAIAELQRTARLLQRQAKRQANVATRLARSARGEREATREQVYRRLDLVARRDGPVIVGPWTGEVGFELLYWAPFVRWAVRKFRIAPGRLVIVSRGGTAAWYGIAGAGYVDAFSLVTPDEFRAGTSGETKKQRTVSTLDRRVLRAVRRQQPGAASVIHPALMYSLYMPYWKQQESIAWVTQAADHARIAAPLPEDLRRRLPGEYVATRFYFSDCFPDTPANRALVARTVDALSRETPVVLLGPGLQVDDHRDVAVDAGARVVSIEDAMRPETNLGIQTAVIAGARAFLGTYGGFSYLAPLCGVPTVAVYSDYTYFAHHLETARLVFDAIGAASFTPVDAAVLPLLRQLTPGAAAPGAAT
ncbi:MAG: hypothetical protein AB7K63_01865 [Vicinamibacterales bacterium]